MTTHQKYTPEWEKEVKRLSLILNGAETDETKQKSKQLEKLLTERETANQEKQKVDQEIKTFITKKQNLKHASTHYHGAKREKTRLDDATNKTTHNPREQGFLGTNTTGTKWNTDGWQESTKNHFTPSTGKLDNLYKIKVGSSDSETTEEQIINTIARVVKSLEKVDADDFETKYNDKESNTTKQGQVKTLLKYLQDQAKEIIIGSGKNGQKNGQKTYDFANTYQKYDQSTDNWTNYTQPAFNYKNFFDFIELTHNQDFLKDLDTDKQKDVVKNETWQISLKGEPYTKEQLADYGINIDPAKTTLYKTGESQEPVIISNGLADWLTLGHTITNHNDNETKITAAFKNSPTQTLLSDIKGWTKGADGYLSNGTYTLPENLASIEELLDELQAEMTGATMTSAKLDEKITTKKDELTTKQTALTAKESEINTLITEIITKKREQLKTYSLEKGFAKTDSEDNRRTETELQNIKRFLQEIRYLENDGNSALPSSVSEENTAFTKVETLIKNYGKYGNKCYLVDAFLSQLAFTKDDKNNLDIQQAITRIKAGKYTDSDGKEQQVYDKLETFAEHFAEKEKNVKLDELEEKAQAAIKVALGKKEDPADTLATYQEKLKTLDPLLDEAIITQAVMDDWKTQNNFKTADTMVAEIKKVIKDNKLDEEFAKLIKKEDADINNIADLFKKKKAKDIITLIRRWEYDKDTDTDKRKKLVWTLEKKGSDGKYLEDAELTDEEINTVLYDIAVGNKTLASVKKADETSRDETQKEPSWFAFRKDNILRPCVTYFGGLAVIGGVLAAIFWEKIKGLNNGPSEEQAEETTESDRNEE